MRKLLILGTLLTLLLKPQASQMLLRGVGGDAGVTPVDMYWNMEGGSNADNLDATIVANSTIGGSGTWSYTPSPVIVVTTTANSGYQAASASYSFTISCSGLSRYLYVGVTMLGVVSTVSSITHNSLALTNIGTSTSGSGAVRAEGWRRIAPSTGSQTIQVTLSVATDSVAGAICFSGVNQTTPEDGSAATATATNVGAADATVNKTTTISNEFVIDTVATDDTTITVGSGQTSRFNITGAVGSGAGSTEGVVTTASTVTMSWTNVGAGMTWAILAVAILPVPTMTVDTSGTCSAFPRPFLVNGTVYTADSGTKVWNYNLALTAQPNTSGLLWQYTQAMNTQQATFGGCLKTTLNIDTFQYHDLLSIRGVTGAQECVIQFRDSSAGNYGFLAEGVTSGGSSTGGSIIPGSVTNTPYWLTGYYNAITGECTAKQFTAAYVLMGTSGPATISTGINASIIRIGDNTHNSSANKVIFYDNVIFRWTSPVIFPLGM